MKERSFTGISAPVLVPFQENGKINYPEFKRLIHYILDNGVKGIFICGTSGEFVNLTIDERKQLLYSAKQEARSDTNIMFNITAMNLHDLDYLVACAKDCDIDAISVTAPYYHKYDALSLIQYFEKVSQHCASLPLYLYNMSGLTQNPISSSVLSEIVGNCSNVKGIKDSSMDFMTLLEYQNAISNNKFEIITGNDAQVLPALQAGASGAIIACANVFPKISVQIYENYKTGNLAEARINQDKIMNVRSIFRSIMPIMAHKKALDFIGFGMGNARFPFRNLTGIEVESLRNKLVKLGILD